METSVILLMKNKYANILKKTVVIKDSIALISMCIKVAQISIWDFASGEVNVNLNIFLESFAGIICMVSAKKEESVLTIILKFLMKKKKRLTYLCSGEPRQVPRVDGADPRSREGSLPRSQDEEGHAQVRSHLPRDAHRTGPGQAEGKGSV